MKSSTTPQAAPLPNAQSWLLALASVCLLIILCSVILSLASIVRMSLATQRLDQALALNDRDSATRYLSIALAERPMLSRLFRTEGRLSRFEKHELCNSILTLGSYLYAGEVTAAEKKFKEIDRGYLSDESFLREAGETVTNRTRALREYLGSYFEIQTLISKDRSSEDERAAIRRGLESRIELTYREMSILFTLPQINIIGSTEVVFYTGGVLKGLPQLAPLPDNIPTLLALKQELARAGGAVRIEGENAHQIFNEKLTQIQKLSDEVRIPYTELIAGEKIRAQKLEEIRSELQRKRGQALYSLSELIIGIASS